MKRDDLIFDIIEKEYQRQSKGIELIASENFVSDQVMQAMGSCLTNKYAEGYPGKRYYGGCEVVDQSERIAIERLKEIVSLGSHDMFIADVLNVKADEKYMNPETGKFELSDADPLVYLHGGSYGLVEKIGKFGWSVEKKKKP